MKHNFERIIGAKTDESRVRIDNELEKIHSSDFPAKFIEQSIEPTQEHQKIVQDVVSYAKKYIAELGIDKPLPNIKLILLKSDNTVLDNADIDIQNWKINGKFLPKPGAIAIRNSEELVNFAERFAHEYFHALGYQAAQTNESQTDINNYRIGLSQHDRTNTDMRYFRDLDEGFVTECSIRFLNSYSHSNPNIKEQIDAMQELRTWFLNSKTLISLYGEIEHKKVAELFNEIIAHPDLSNLIKSSAFKVADDTERILLLHKIFDIEDLKERTLPYHKERKKLQEIILSIYKTTPNSTPESIFNEFAKAHFTGNYLPIARLIEKTFGKGGFRKLAEETASNLNT